MTSSAERHLEPTEAQFQSLAAAAQGNHNPVVMVNLLSFDGEDGRDSYLRYAAAVQPFLDRVGGSVVYAGNAEQTIIGGSDKPWWDVIVLVRYPSRAKFLQMVLDPSYRAVAEHRTVALQTSALVATAEWMGT